MAQTAASGILMCAICTLKVMMQCPDQLMSAQLKGPYWEKGILSTETWTFGRTPTHPGTDTIYLIPTLFDF